ncbi:hypothetical protein Athai_38420 [Actinocatenispora thailandica]|uniref:Glycoside hydrolase 123-like N-terminal domain-containing protein n=1 Tax=Actinocatenispora thailandica TaxID=227318 RepID=A0A7R7DR42_9ACTN|nr:glycoside hydrolase domain-containing protein [Actinocatenispora thailandica]BCJ36339.1 hypothetical protein Athai_38420 [Actinocatenispora thailandica]
MPATEAISPESWDTSTYGNHRAVVTVRSQATAVAVPLPWRLPSRHRGGVIVHAPDGDPVPNAFVAAGRCVFEPDRGPGDYLVYYLPYAATGSASYPEHEYLAPTAPDPAWAPTADRAAATAESVHYQAIDEHHRYTEMERPAVTAPADPGLLVFGEDRDHPIRMRQLPARWLQNDHCGRLHLCAEPGEYHAFQLGVYGTELTDVAVEFAALSTSDGELGAGVFECLTLGGFDETGAPIRRRLDVPDHTVAALWCGATIPPDAPAGDYRGRFTVTAGSRSATVAVTLTIADPAAAPPPATRAPTREPAGPERDDPVALCRLRWLNSRIGSDDSVVRPYHPVRVDGETLRVLGRSVALAGSGLPAQLTSFYTPDGQLGTAPTELLAAPVTLTVRDADGVPHEPLAARRPGAATGAHADWSAHGNAAGVTVELSGRLEFDGALSLRIELVAADDVELSDVALELPLRSDAVPYLMGLGVSGGTRPSTVDWHWDVARNQDAVWLGDVAAGVQVQLSDEHYVRPLNTNFYHQRPLVLPESWHNDGRGGIRTVADGPVLRLCCYGGPRRLGAGQRLRFDARLLLTPFKPLRTDRHFAQRYLHDCRPVGEAAATGATVVNIHHATPVNPYLNYPFLTPGTLESYVDDAHAAGLAVKLYYTVRELSTRAPELFALLSLGDEVFARGPGGGCSWLREHVDDDRLPAWYATPTEDSSLIVDGGGRFLNYYLAGLDKLVRSAGIDGIYLDDIAFDRRIMLRLRRILDRGRPEPLIDVHSANQYNERDGFASSANLYLEHLPYTDRLWFGEYFDHDAPPDRWLVEMSGLPYGLTGEMLQDGGNPWRGMIFGMTGRLGHGADPRPLWSEWDAFGIDRARMLGHWSPANPARTGRDDVLATTYLRAGPGAGAGTALVAVASWAPEPVEVALSLDPAVLPAGPVRAAPIDGFQPARSCEPGESLPVPPGGGWLLRVGW